MYGLPISYRLSAVVPYWKTAYNDEQTHINKVKNERPCGWFNIKMPSYQHRKSHCGDKTILLPSYLHNGISYAGKMTSLYWIRALLSNRPNRRLSDRILWCPECLSPSNWSSRPTETLESQSFLTVKITCELSLISSCFHFSVFTRSQCLLLMFIPLLY